MTAPVSEEARKVLRELGLTEYETRAYLALLERGVLTASQVSDYSNVPYSKIYETLGSLERKGWIETDRGRPSRHFPRAPSEALTTMKLQMEERVKSWETTILGELQPLFEKREIREKPDIWILRGEFNILAKLEEILDKTRTELMVAAPAFTETLSSVFARMLMRLQGRGVKILFMVAGVAKEWNVREIASIAEVRIRDQMFGGGVIIDGKEAVLFLGEEKPILVIWSNHLGLVRFARDYFQHLWKSSTTVRNKRAKMRN